MKTSSLPPSKQHILFIDSHVPDYDFLSQGAKPDTQIYLIDSEQDGIRQITDILKQQRNLDSVHIVSHGQPAKLILGNSFLSAETLSAYQLLLKNWIQAFTEKTEILLYGCQVAKDISGKQFVFQLSKLLQTPIAASVDLTGAKLKGGNWELAFQTTSVSNPLVFEQTVLEHYDGILAAETISFTEDELSGEPLASYTKSTTGYGNLTIKGTDSGLATAFSSLTSLTPPAGLYDSLTQFGPGISTGIGLNDGSNGGTVGTWLVFTSANGGEFDLVSLKMTEGLGVFTTMEAIGFRDGAQVGTQTFSLTTATTNQTITMNSTFDNVDEVRIRQKTTGYYDSGTPGQDGVLFENFVFQPVPNTTPTISIANTSLSYLENASASQIDSAATLSDADGDADWNGGTLVAQITANSEAADRLSIPDNVVGTINTSGTDLLNGATVIGNLSASEGTVTGGTALTVTFNSNATNALVQQVVQAVHYDNTSDDPGTANRTVTFTATDKNAASASDTRTIAVTPVNDAPTLSATGSDPNFTEDGAAAGLFGSAGISTIESGQTVTGLTLTVTNVNDGSSEQLNVDGSSLTLTNGTSGTTATNSLNYSVAVSGSTATVTLSGGTLSTAAAQTLINAISYQNNSQDPSTSNRVVTITSLTDSGGTANGGADTTTLSIASTVTVMSVNDAPTLSATGSNPIFDQGGTAADLFSTVTASAVESSQTLEQLTITVTNVTDGAGANEFLSIDGQNVALSDTNSGTTAANSMSYSVALATGTATVALSKPNMSAADVQTLIDGLAYSNNSTSPSNANRVVTITSLKDNGGTANGGTDTAALSIASTVSVIPSPTITSATYDYSTNQLVVTGANFVAEVGAANDVDISLLTITGEGGATYTLTSATDVEIDSATQFTLPLSGADLTNVDALLNNDGTTSAGGTTYNLSAADNWMAQTSVTADISDTTNAITVSNYAAPAITSATYDVSTGQLVITGTHFVSKSGAANDLDASLLTITGDWGSYTLTDTSDVDITDSTSATLTLSAKDQLNINGLLNKNGTVSGGAVTYNLAAADNWLPGSPAASDISDATGNGITVSNVAIPTITSAMYDAPNHNLSVTGTNFFKKPGVNNDIDASLLTMIGGDSASYTLATTQDVEITSATSFTMHISNGDDSTLYGIYNMLGTQSSYGTVYDLQVADGWLTAADPAINIADNAEGGVDVIISPMLTSSTYNATTGTLVVTGSNIQANSGGSDIDVSRLIFAGEDGATYTLTDSADVELDSTSQFTVTLSATDKAAVNALLNKNGTTSTGGTTYNLDAADDWNTNITGGDTSDSSGITVTNVPVPTITSATYDASTGVLTVTGTDFKSAIGAANDIVANKFTVTGEGAETYTLTDTTSVDITSGTAFTLTLSATDKAAVNQIINKDGTTSTGGTTYNLAAAEDWAAGADVSVNIVDATGNGITTSNVSAPSIASATYNASTGILVVTGSGLLKLTGINNDIDASLFTFTGLGRGIHTLTDTADVDITSGTEFTLTLSTADKAAVNALLNTNGTSASDSTTYNLAAAEDWTTGANAAVNIVDATGNGITVTLPSPSGGGSGSDAATATSTTIIDGVTTTTWTEADGSTTLIVPVIEDTRIEDPTSLLETHADFSILANDAGDPVLTVSLPKGVGLSVNGQAESMTPQDAIDDLTQRIEQETATDNDTLMEITAQSQNFIATLAETDVVSVQTITLTVDNNQAPDQPIIINGSNLLSDNKQALIIDAGNLPTGTVIQLDNVAFAAIIGASHTIGGAGDNFVVGDNKNQFIVLGAGDDTLFGGGGNDTVGSLGGNDQTAGDAGDDIVFGGAGNDNLTGGDGNDALNGGLGFDTAMQAGRLSDYQINIQGDHITLTNNNGDVDILTDIERVEFENGPSLAIAHTVAEAAAHHLVKTWLGRDLTAAEGRAVQSWIGADAGDIVNVFRTLPEAKDFKSITDAELLVGIDDNPDIVQLAIVRDLVGGDNNDRGYLPLGLALNADAGGGYDVLQMTGNRSDVYLEQIGNAIEITRLEDGAMLSLKNAEMIAFDSGENILLAHTQVEGILGRLFQTFFDRDATIDEWQLGRDAIANHIHPDTVLGWFQENAGLSALDDVDYIQALYSQTLARQATENELNLQQLRLENGEITRDWLAVDIANSDEAITTIGSVLVLDNVM